MLKNVLQTIGKKKTKELCQLYYREKILELHSNGKSIRAIEEYLNKQCIPHSRFKGITLSRNTIHKIIKQGNKDESN